MKWNLMATQLAVLVFNFPASKLFEELKVRRKPEVSSSLLGSYLSTLYFALSPHITPIT
jgi:hypothetical protein